MELGKLVAVFESKTDDFDRGIGHVKKEIGGVTGLLGKSVRFLQHSKERSDDE